jgi:hypothetical protein
MDLLDWEANRGDMKIMALLARCDNQSKVFEGARHLTDDQLRSVYEHQAVFGKTPAFRKLAEIRLEALDRVAQKLDGSADAFTLRGRESP